MPYPLLCVQTPFIRYEYILPTQPPISSRHGMEASLEPPAHDRGDQSSSYRVLYPYVPPALEREFYTPPTPQSFYEPTPLKHTDDSPSDEGPSPPHTVLEGAVKSSVPLESGRSLQRAYHSFQVSPGPRVVDMPIINRSFHPYETHHAEESLLLIDPDSPPSVMYDSNQFEQFLTVEAEKITPKRKTTEVVNNTVEDNVLQSAAAEEEAIVTNNMSSSPNMSKEETSDPNTAPKQDVNGNKIKDKKQLVSLDINPSFPIIICICSPRFFYLMLHTLGVQCNSFINADKGHLGYRCRNTSERILSCQFTPTCLLKN